MNLFEGEIVDERQNHGDKISENIRSSWPLILENLIIFHSLSIRQIRIKGRMARFMLERK
jgi:hypothetical protein